MSYLRAGLVLLLLSACSGTPIQFAVPARQSAARAYPGLAYVLEVCSRRSKPCPKAGGFVQILGGDTITDGLQNPVSIAVSPTRELYVANELNGRTSGSVTIYAPGRATPRSSIARIKGSPDELSITSTGYVFVASQYQVGCCQLRTRVGMYVAGTSRPVRILRDLAPFASAPVIDASDRLYVTNFDVFPGWIAVYSHGKARPTRLLRDGIGFPEGLAVMPDGTLFVLNRKFDHRSDILVYAPGSASVTRTIVAGLDRPLAIALDGHGDLYVANFGRKSKTGNVSVYAAGSASVARVIHHGIDRPVDLGIDRSGRLWVANSPASGAGTVTLYARDASSPLKTYRLGQSALALAVAF